MPPTAAATETITLTIDGRAVSVPPGTMVWDAARLAGVEIPALCRLPGHASPTTCLVCLVQVGPQGRLVPSCATPCSPGMQVRSDVPEVREARKASLELLLSSHHGQCLAPCERACPLELDIPLMLRAMREARPGEAIRVIRDSVPLASILGRLCHKPCEKACLRGQVDGPVAICHVKCHVADADLAASTFTLPPVPVDAGRLPVAVWGSGPAGLAAAYRLRQLGLPCVVWDAGPTPGGSLLEDVAQHRVPANILEGEVELLKRMGVTFASTQPDGIAGVINTTEHPDPQGLPVFRAGHGPGARRHLVFAVSEGKRAADDIAHQLVGTPAHHHDLLVTVARDAAIETVRHKVAGLPGGGAAAVSLPVLAATRCVECSCDAQDACDLRRWAQEYDCDPRLFPQRLSAQPIVADGDYLFDAGKCILCGRCVTLTEACPDARGLVLSARGAHTQLVVPHGATLTQAMGSSARECVRWCPTGALALKGVRYLQPADRERGDGA